MVPVAVALENVVYWVIIVGAFNSNVVKNCIVKVDTTILYTVDSMMCDNVSYFIVRFCMQDINLKSCK